MIDYANKIHVNRSYFPENPSLVDKKATRTKQNMRRISTNTKPVTGIGLAGLETR